MPQSISGLTSTTVPRTISTVPKAAVVVATTALAIMLASAACCGCIMLASAACCAMVCTQQHPFGSFCTAFGATFGHPLHAVCKVRARCKMKPTSSSTNEHWVTQTKGQIE